MKAKWWTLCGGFVVIVAVGLLLYQKPPLLSPEVRAAAVQFLSIDDESDLVEPAAAAVVNNSLPPGVSLAKERVITGAGNLAVRTFARVVVVNGDSQAVACERLLAWAATLRIPEGDRVAIGEFSSMDQDPSPKTSMGWRTYLVRKDPILTGADVQDTISQGTNQGWAVAVRLNPDGSRRFDAYTRGNIKRRMATLVDGKVLSTAMIAREVPDGRLQLTLPNGNSGRHLADRFVHAITGR